MEFSFIWPFVASDQGNKYIAYNKYSEWSEAVKISVRKAKSTARTIYEYIITRDGIPKKILIDQGSQFESSLLKEIFNDFNIHKTRLSAYHPEGNGLAEPNASSIKDKPCVLIVETGRKRDLNLPIALISLRYLVNDSTSYSSFEILNGSKPNTVSETIFVEREYNTLHEHKYIAKISSKLTIIYEYSQ